MAAFAGRYLLLSVYALRTSCIYASDDAECASAASDSSFSDYSRRGPAMLQARVSAHVQRASLGSRASRARMIASSSKPLMLGKRFTEHNELLSVAMHSMDKGMVDSNSELDDLIEDFISKQAGSEDKCSSQLLEAKHQLSQLHLSMTDISIEINHTEQEINQTTKELEEATKVLQQYEYNCLDLKVKCEEEFNETYAMWKILQEELLEMKMIANPSHVISEQDMWKAAERSQEVSSTSTTGVYTSTSGHVSSTSTTSGEWSTGHGPESTTSTSGWSTSSGDGTTSTSGLYSTGESTTGYGASTSKQWGSLLQEGAKVMHTSSSIKRQTPQVNSVRGLVKKTRVLAKDLEACRTRSSSRGDPISDSRSGQSLLQEAASKQQPADFNMDTHGLPQSWRDATDIDIQGHTEMKKKNNIYCSANASVVASVGPSSKELATGKPLNPGEHVSYRCQDINDEWEGFVWLMCDVSGGIAVDNSHCFNTAMTNNACRQQMYFLEITYVKAYVELTRLVDAYATKVNETDCDLEVDKICEERSRPVFEKVNTLTVSLTELTQKVIQVKGRVTIGHEAEQKLTQHIRALKKECTGLSATTSALDKVRDVISVMGACPGLRRPDFHIPEWTGEWVVAELDTRLFTDDELDNKLHLMCRQNGATGQGLTIRAAEVSEIQLQTVEGMPVVNTALVPLIGACPNCEGKPDDTDDEDAPRHPSGHARICWDSQKPLDPHHSRKDCSSGKKAVMCVVDKGDMHKVPS